MLVLLPLAALAQDPTAVVPAEVPAPAPLDLAWHMPAGTTLRLVSEVTTGVDTPNGPQKTTVGTTTEQTVASGGRVGSDAIAWKEKVTAQSVDIDMAGQKTSWKSGDEGDPPGGF